MSTKRIALLTALAAVAVACDGEAPEAGSIEEAPEAAAGDTMAGPAAPFPAAVAQDPCFLVETVDVARWTGSEVRRLEARLPTVDGAGQARAACVAFPQSAAVSDVPFFEVVMVRPIQPAADAADRAGEGSAFAVVGDTGFELRCERCGDQAGAALRSIVANYDALTE